MSNRQNRAVPKSNKAQKNTNNNNKNSDGSRRRRRRRQRNGPDQIDSAPVAYAYTMRNSQPRISGSRGMVITHREMIATLTHQAGESLDFVSRLISTNPGIQTSFPWLSVVAQQFEMYQFKKLSFEFVSNLPSTATGKVMLAYDYDAADGIPTDRVSYLSLQPSAETSIWKSLVLPINLKDSSPFGSNRRYVRNGTIPADTDLRMYDLGFVLPAWANLSGDVNSVSSLGDIWVSYTVELFKPQVNFRQIATNSSAYRSSEGLTGVSKTWPLGSAADKLGNSLGSLPVTWQSGGTNTVNIVIDEIGSWLLSVIYDGTGITGNLGANAVNSRNTITQLSNIINGTAESCNIFKVVNNVAGGAFAGGDLNSAPNNFYLDFSSACTTLVGLSIYLSQSNAFGNYL